MITIAKANKKAVEQRKGLELSHKALSDLAVSLAKMRDGANLSKLAYLIIAVDNLQSVVEQYIKDVEEALKQ